MKKVNRKVIVTTVIAMLFLLAGCSGSYPNSSYIELGEYKGVEIDYQDIKWTKEQLDYEINLVLYEYSHEITIKKDDVVMNEDIVMIDYSGTIDNKPFEGGANVGYSLTVGSNEFLYEFEQALIGKPMNESFTVEIDFPSDYKEPDGQLSKLASKHAVFSVKVNEITRRIYPEYNDEFVKRLDIGFSDVSEYEQYLIFHIEKYNKTQKAWEKAVDSVVVKKYPKTVDNRTKEIREYYEYYMLYYGYTSFNDFCIDALGQTEQEFDELNLLSAKQGVVQEMTAQAIASLEKIELTSKELSDGYDNYAEYYGYENTTEFLNDYDEESIKTTILVNKIMDFVSENAVIINE